jgi:hypothetical protein
MKAALDIFKNDNMATACTPYFLVSMPGTWLIAPIRPNVLSASGLLSVLGISVA